ncbi:MAG TPA: ABC transporter ATP-binding protein [Balneolaceae bacterium]|nr:ABC transporter ATP-binding protein [Balneolaceae bacterium]
MDSTFILEVKNLTKIFGSGSRSLTVLDNVGFSVTSGSTCSIVGPSGSGKTTLLGLCAGLDKPSSGSVNIKEKEISRLTEEELSVFRNRNIGFVFQSFQLISTLTAKENVMVPLELRNEPYKEVENRAEFLLEKTGLKDRMTHYPSQLSGGEKQRVGIARAFIHNPDILFADEPTGNLDGETSEHIEELLFDLNSEQGTTLVIVTHDVELAKKCSRTISLKNGKIDYDSHSEMIQTHEADKIDGTVLNK